MCILHFAIHGKTIGYNVYMWLAGLEMAGCDILALGQHRMLAVIFSGIKYVYTFFEKIIPLIHWPIMAYLRRWTQFYAPEWLTDTMPVLPHKELHIHQDIHRRVRLAGQRVKLNVVGGKEDWLVLLPQLFLVENIVDGVSGMFSVYRFYLYNHDLFI